MYYQYLFFSAVAFFLIGALFSAARFAARSPDPVTGILMVALSLLLLYPFLQHWTGQVERTILTCMFACGYFTVLLIHHRFWNPNGIY